MRMFVGMVIMSLAVAAVAYIVCLVGCNGVIFLVLAGLDRKGTRMG